MTQEISRRNFLRGTLAGAIVIAGFDTRLRSWVSAAELDATSLAEDFPDFDGVLLLDEASRTAAADDFGHMVHRQPFAVLKPASVDDVVDLVRFARRNNIKVAARGQAHSTQGQSQVDAGVVVDMTTLAAVHEINPTNALVDGGTRWLDVVTQAVA
ncbi:MAG TPA: FAD-binding protein, partial [Pyrinomonadaceae bacterium]|nr:FAD-binding protein [Pyrinomonadaceae bacterium]